jgi:predicted alpha/beta hydrolase family esterase
MHQCLIIHGGESFATEEEYYAFLEARELDDPTKPAYKKRRDTLVSEISHAYQVFMPEMPCKQRATYKAWKIRFEKYLPFFGEDKICLIGYSLGGCFLAKRLSENKFPKKIDQLHLVAACISSEGLDGESLGDFQFEHSNLSHLEWQCGEIFLYHSRDDEIVPYAQAELLKSYLPKATLLTFETRNHFFQPSFPELLENMRVYSR